MEFLDLVIVEQAIIEMEDTFEFYNAKIEGLGDAFNEEVFDLLDTIQENPLLFPVKFGQVHEAVLLRFPFVVTYEVVENKIVVLSVFHTKRNPEEKIERRKIK